MSAINFNPLSPHGERPPLEAGREDQRKYFNPLSPHGERRDGRKPCRLDWKFQSTLPAWGETAFTARFWPNTKFQSTLPAWGETQGFEGRFAARLISIHSPRMGRDGTVRSTDDYCYDFNPLSPHGERLTVTKRSPAARLFQSTLPAWGETLLMGDVKGYAEISIHSPRMGRDKKERDICGHLTDFNPLSPHGERLKPLTLNDLAIEFQSTLPAWGETQPAR